MKTACQHAGHDAVQVTCFAEVMTTDNRSVWYGLGWHQYCLQGRDMKSLLLHTSCCCHHHAYVTTGTRQVNISTIAMRQRSLENPVPPRPGSQVVGTAVSCKLTSAAGRSVTLNDIDYTYGTAKGLICLKQRARHRLSQHEQQHKQRSRLIAQM